MAYLAFYRTFRPTTFEEVVRQEHIVRILKNQIESGKIGHAYLFCGPRGTGKTTLAKIFARAINCEHPVDSSPCGKCAACKALADGSNMDVLEIDAASNNGVDEMRDLREKVQYPPVAGKYKVYIIDEVHMLSPSAFNAVLKTLEEPPRHAVFVLATTEPQKIPATIMSRCMRFDFKLIPQKDLEELVRSVFIKTGKEFEDEAVSAIARAGAGSARDSLSIADMCASYSNGKLTYADVSAVLGSADSLKIASLCESILNEDAASAITASEEILSTGKSVGVLIKDLLALLNNLTVIKVCRSAREIVNIPEENYSRLEAIASKCDGHKLLRVSEILAKAETDMRYSANGRITLETAIYKCAMPQADYNLDALIGKINSLEKKLADGEYKIYAAPAAATAAEQTKREKDDNPPSPPERGPSARQAETLPRDTSFERDEAGDPFSAPRKDEPVQPSLWENAVPEKPVGNLSVRDKNAVFAKFIKSLRTTRKNAVLFTLCMDLECDFEGEKLVFFTHSEAVYKALNRTDNAKYISECLAELGVSEHEVRLKQKGESQFDKSLNELKENFNGIDIDIK